MTQHTPGPWTSRLVASGWLIEAGDTDETYAQIAMVLEDGPNPEAYEHNARLIAAAPELLEALQVISLGLSNSSIAFTKKRQSDSDAYHPANVLMCAAIQKATEQ